MTAFEERLGYTFHNKDLLRQALTHSSYKSGLHSNERLEFLGDSLLNLTVALILYEMYPNETEGDLSKRRGALVRAEVLAEVAKELELDKEILLGRGILNNDRDRNQPAIIGNAMEAVIGAVCIDAGNGAEGRAQAIELVRRLWIERARKMELPPPNPKSELQQWVQKKTGTHPKYGLIAEEGPDHDRMYTVRLTCPGLKDQLGRAKIKQKAEEAAAIAMLEAIGKEESRGR